MEVFYEGSDVGRILSKSWLLGRPGATACPGSCERSADCPGGNPGAIGPMGDQVENWPLHFRDGASACRELPDGDGRQRHRLARKNCSSPRSFRNHHPTLPDGEISSHRGPVPGLLECQWLPDGVEAGKGVCGPTNSGICGPNPKGGVSGPRQRVGIQGQGQLA